MNEKIIKFEKSNNKNKKYMAIIKDINTNKIRKIHFGGNGYEQFKDSTGLGYYSNVNHSDNNRRRNYFSRHSNGIKTKQLATIYEIKKSNGYYNAKILSHIYLW